LRIDREGRRRIRRPSLGEKSSRVADPMNRDASSASSIGATRGRISGLPSPRTA